MGWTALQAAESAEVSAVAAAAAAVAEAAADDDVRPWDRPAFQRTCAADPAETVCIFAWISTGRGAAQQCLPAGCMFAIN